MSKKPIISATIKILSEAEGHVVTVEMLNNEQFRGTLSHSEDNMNCELRGVTHRARNGMISKMESVFIRGGQIRYFLLPELLKNAKEFESIRNISTEKQKDSKRKADRSKKR
eukprot:CAMPEP_0202687330 /NCGR_PEP_ID=MMETSP1385-20130828/3020_1 /ASSEMBLY_ACC=CAM_ASM_000861 /TAXON_ID=933848 /ORGANISM="Elphidium margaritaceum" /LENGTH=111 /DNA_ID=CAMNT_0049342101 /DNA_START=27 /DNA_END=362 /DNA_ORIENTATION=+